MRLNYYLSFESKNAQRWVPGIKALNLTKERWDVLTQDTKTAELIKAFREGDKDAKTKLPAVCWSGYTQEGNTRKIESMTPTGLYIIDIDHINKSGEPPQKTWEYILNNLPVDVVDAVRLVFITPSGYGLRLVMQCTENFTTLAEHMEWLDKIIGFNQYGDFDTAVKDVSRLSFIPQASDILFESPLLWEDKENYNPIINDNKDNKDNPLNSLNQREARLEPLNQKRYEQQKVSHGGNGANAQWTPVRSIYTGETYRGTPLTEIIDKYIEVYGTPEKGEMHNFYNKMVRDFRNICNNDPRILHDLLPRFGGDNATEYVNTLSQCQSICRTNSNSSIPREFFIFLAKNGFYRPSKSPLKGDFDDEDDDDEASPFKGDRRGSPVDLMPTPPPVIKELISIAPKDFVIPAINALFPILGTLTSYVRSEDRQNGKVFSTSFFSVIYAPPSSGKSFMERYINYLLHNIMLRDEVNDARDAVYARSQQTKSANDKGEKLPQTSVRIMEAKNSEAEFLEKQRNNKGHHMFTYCAEIDQWRKGIRAAGGNKDDMVRIAWDNGIYGQNYKSANTFKGKVQLFWNVLLAGTDDQVAVYFKNVTNGLVTRCSFTHIDNQQFQEVAPQWKKLSKKDMKKVDDFLARCEMNTYTEPFTYNPQDAYLVDDKDFDSEVPWHFDFKPLQYIDVDWINSTVNKFQKEQCRKAMIDNDEARDTFRRRVGDRGKRIALLCTQLYGKPMTDKDKKACAKWIEWWMEQDLNAICKTFGSKYQQAMQETALPDGTQQKTILQRLPNEFNREDVRRVADILGYKTRAQQIVHNWITAGVVERFAKNEWRKVSPKK